MTAMYILGLATACFIASLNIRDELRARRARKESDHHETRKL